MSKAKELADAHWDGYVGLLANVHSRAAYTHEEVMRLCAFHYKTAFAHGFKHGVEDAKEGTP